MGAEMGLNEADLIAGTPIVSSTKAYTGTYSFRMDNASLASVGRTISPIAELRARCMLNHNGNSSGAGSRSARIIQLGRNSGNSMFLIADGSNAVLSLTRGTTPLVTVTPASVPGWVTTNSWMDISVAFKASATVGFFRAYLNGREFLAFSGDTNAGNIDYVTFGGGVVSGWIDFAYFDDMYVESSAGEAAQPCSARRLYCGYANGNGSQSQLTGSDGNSVNNYQQVDDAQTPDGDTTYNLGASSGLQDLYAHAAITLADGFSPVAYCPMLSGKRSDGAIASTFKVASRENSTTQLSAAKTLTTAYAPVSEIYTLMPDASAIDMTKLNNLEIGIETAGAYS